MKQNVTADFNATPMSGSNIGSPSPVVQAFKDSAGVPQQPPHHSKIKVYAPIYEEQDFNM